MKYKKLFLVKREILATSIEKAMIGKGKIYSIELAEEKYQPESKNLKKKVGFNKIN